jgi:phage replication-related protein YjqB (UPF0714/DUF867 family)
VEDAAGKDALRGEDPANIANRTLLGMGAQLEITRPQRAALFGSDTLTRPLDSTSAAFARYVAAVRAAIARIEAAQPIA